MSGLSLNKTALKDAKDKLAIYSRFLPSLELKRDQLLVERNGATRRLTDIDRALSELLAAVGEDLPMLANLGIQLDGLARVREVRMGSEQILGMNLPVLCSVDIAVAEYGYLTTPHWVDAVMSRLRAAMRLTLSRQVESERLAILERALKRVNQRVNLFEKVLIPQTRQTVKAIQVGLADAEKAAVVRAKLAKSKRLGCRPA
jgi:V/A-type H+-transporting ATPase subunit D